MKSGEDAMTQTTLAPEDCEKALLLGFLDEVRRRCLAGGINPKGEGLTMLAEIRLALVENRHRKLAMEAAA